MFLKNKNIIFKIRRSKVTEYAALRSILFLIFLFIVFHNWTGYLIVTPDHLFHPLNHKYLDTKIIDIIV